MEIRAVHDTGHECNFSCSSSCSNASHGNVIIIGFVRELGGLLKGVCSHTRAVFMNDKGEIHSDDIENFTIVEKVLYDKFVNFEANFLTTRKEES